MEMGLTSINAPLMKELRLPDVTADAAFNDRLPIPLLDAPVIRSLDDDFRSSVTAVLGRFRQAVEKVVFSVTKTLQNSRSLQTAFGVDLNVSWQVYKLLGPIETLSTVPYMPAGVSIRKLLAAAKKRGVAADALEEVAAAFAAFEELVTHTTGDREQFESLVMSFTDSPEAIQVGMQLRKAAFKANAHFFGVVADTVALALMFHPGSAPNQVDFLGLRAMMGLRRMRANTDVVVERWKVNPEVTGPDGHALSDALDLESALCHNAPVLPEFCSKPLLPLSTTVDHNGNVRTILEHRDLGVGREVDIATGRVFRGAPLRLNAAGRPIFQGLSEIARPTRVQVIDSFVHRPTWPNLTPTGGVFAHLPTRNTADAERGGVRLPCHEKLTYMGSGDDVLRISEAPRYAELVKYACRKMNWSFEDMDLYRIRLEYPLMDSNVLCRLESTT